MDARQEQSDTCSRWYLQVKISQNRGCIAILLTVSCPCRLTSLPQNQMQLIVTQYHQLARILSPGVTPTADCLEEQDLCNQVLDYIAGRTQQVDTDKISAPPDLSQEAEVMAFSDEAALRQADGPVLTQLCIPLCTQRLALELLDAAAANVECWLQLFRCVSITVFRTSASWQAPLRQCSTGSDFEHITIGPDLQVAEPVIGPFGNRLWQ